jgi:CHAT domain-containing protein
MSCSQYSAAIPWSLLKLQIAALYSHGQRHNAIIPAHFRVRKILIPKAATMPLTAFIVTVVLLIASTPLALEQGGRASERELTEAARRAEDLFREALLLSDAEDNESARLKLQEAMNLWTRMGESGKAAKAALQIGDHYRRARKFREALDCYRQSLEVKALPALTRANALNAIATVYSELHQTDLAVYSFKRALDQARSINDLPAQALALTGLARAHYSQGDIAQASTYITRAQRLNRQSNAETEPAMLCLLGQISQKEGLLDKAKGAFEEAFEIYRKALNIEGQIGTLTLLSSLHLLSSNKQEALKKAEEAVEMAEKEAKRATSHAEKVNARALRWRAWLSRARAERALGEKKRAVKSYFWAINYFEANWWATYIATEASAIAFREEVQEGYREYVDLVVEEGKINEAYELADAAKARTILNLIEARRLTPPSAGNNSTQALSELSQSIAQLRLQMLASNITPESQAKLQRAIEDAEYKMQELHVEAEIEQSKKRLVWSPLATAERLQTGMAREQAALAEFFLGNERSFLWLFAQGEVHFEILPARKEIEQAVRLYLDVLTSTPSPLHIERDIAKVREQSEALFSRLFGRLSSLIAPNQRLIIVPDGMLHYLPFETLLDNSRYLVEDHEISYISSAGLLGLWQDSASRADSKDKMELFAVGNPLFEPKSISVAAKKAKNVLRKTERQMLAARGFRLTPLARTQDEVQYIASLFPPDRRKVLIGRESTEEAIKREPLRRYRRLHLATHGLIDERSPLRSSIALTPGDEAGEDGFLEVSEIARLSLDCDLVVVSACQTGRGKLLSGEGIVGLSRAFLYAGARSVVVSLWNVTEISTNRLMKDFYQHLAAGLHNVSALRRAKLQMLNSGKETRHPYYWSSFVMVGKPQ